MGDDFIKKAVEDSLTTFLSLETRRAQLEQEIEEIEQKRAKLTLKIISLARLCDDLPPGSTLAEILRETSQIGLTGAVTSVLRGSDDWVTTIQVRDQLIKVGYDLERYKNALAAINTVLSRFDPKQVESTTDEETGKTMYRWRKPPTDRFKELAALPPKEVKRIVSGAAKNMVGSSAKKKASKKE
jgi:hypothetical protein